MPDKVTFAKTCLSLERAIDIAHQRHTHITSNISNLDTPNYKPKEIDFEQALSQALQSQRGLALARTNTRHIDLGINEPGRVEPFEQEGEWNGFNWVEIDKEMTKLTENNLVYRTAIETLLRKLTLLKEVIREGGR
ncbi:MAG TPA: flagellar basal body rod protein FlgB [Desulfatiglandales bacterium]|nr:flagellar basal body rod protein FlgB [Desulfatiglandales bacterium]